ncbi:MAG: hypothetical protein AAB583_05810 [Patescibacteria group bacterium]
MSEVDSSPENPKIPENWDIPRDLVNNPKSKAIQVDEKERLAAFAIAGKRRMYNYQKPADVMYYHDFIFDREGKLKASRKNHGFKTIIELNGEQKIEYWFYEEDKDPSVYKILSTEIYFTPVFLDEKKYLINRSLGAFKYPGSGDLTAAMLGNVFEGYQEKSFIYSPQPQLIIRGGDVVEITNEIWPMSRKYPDNAQPIPKDFTYIDKEGKESFRVEWRSEEGYFILSQKHIPSGILKTLKAPLKLDMEKVSEAAYSKPPYGKERIVGQDRLVVPWRNIDRLVGAGLSYSYPSPKT